MSVSPRPRRTFRHRTAIGFVAAAAAISIAPPAGAQPSDPATDRNGYVGTAAYCQGSAAAVAFGRTAEALVAICKGPDGQLQYRGVRLSDESALMLTATADGAGGFTAENGDVVYDVSSAELVVTDGDTTLHRQSMLQYYAPSAD
jgi:putative hemolysin